MFLKNSIMSDDNNADFSQLLVLFVKKYRHFLISHSSLKKRRQPDALSKFVFCCGMTVTLSMVLGQYRLALLEGLWHV